MSTILLMEQNRSAEIPITRSFRANQPKYAENVTAPVLKNAHVHVSAHTTRNIQHISTILCQI